MSESYVGDSRKEETTSASLPYGLTLFPDPLLLPSHYFWYLLVSSMDLMLTWLILGLGGHEVNAIADRVLQVHGFPGLIIYKFTLVIAVILFCEQIGRMDLKKAKQVLVFAIAVTSIPVVWSFLLLIHEVSLINS